MGQSRCSADTPTPGVPAPVTWGTIKAGTKMGTATEDHTRVGGPHSWRLYLRHQLQGAEREAAETPSTETVALHGQQGGGLAEGTGARQAGEAGEGQSGTEESDPQLAEWQQGWLRTFLSLFSAHFTNSFSA